VGVLPLEFGEFFEFVQGFGFDGFGFVLVVEDGFEFLLFAEDGTQGLGIVQGEAAFLEPGVAFEGDRFACFRVRDFGERELLAVDFGDFGHEIERVNSLVRVLKEPDDVKNAAFVFDDYFPALEPESPVAVAFPEGEGAVDWWISGFLDCWGWTGGLLD